MRGFGIGHNESGITTDAQLYLAIGVPTITVLIGILVSAVNSNTLISRFNSLESRFDTLLGKVIEIDNRLVRLEERLEHMR